MQFLKKVDSLEAKLWHTSQFKRKIAYAHEKKRDKKLALNCKVEECQL